jgi:hypothetical protein
MEQAMTQTRKMHKKTVDLRTGLSKAITIQQKGANRE